MNFLNLGFIFGAEDKGLTEAQKKFGKGFGALSVSAKETEGTISRLSVTNQELTTAFEADLTARNKLSKHTLTNMGVFGKELAKTTSKAVGLSLDLNTSAESAAVAIAAWDRSQGHLSKTLKGGERDFLKLTEASGANANTLRDTALSLSKLGASDDQIQDLLDSMAKMGQVTGDVGGALNSLPDVMQDVQQRAALMGVTLDPKTLVDYAKQQAAVAAGFASIGDGAEKSRTLASALTKALLGSQENIQDMFAGTKEDLDSFATNMSVSLGDANVALSQMKKGPAEFMQTMTDMVQNAKKNGRLTEGTFNFLRAHMKQSLGPAADDIVNYLQKATGAEKAVMATVQNSAKGTLQVVADAYTTGYTYQDAIRLASDSMMASFRSISDQQTRTFVTDAKKTFSQFNGFLHDTVKKGGPLGSFVVTLSEISKEGIAALFPDSLKGKVGAAASIFEQFEPLIQKWSGGMSEIASLLFSPKGLLMAIGGLVAWFYKLRATGLSTKQAISSIVGVFKDFLHTIDFKGIATQVDDFLAAIPDAVDVVVDSLKDIWGEFLAPAGDRIMAGLGKIPWGKVADKLGDFVQEYFPKVWDRFIEPAGNAIIRGLSRIPWGKIGDTLSYYFDKYVVPRMIPDINIPIYGALFGSYKEAAAARVKEHEDLATNLPSYSVTPVTPRSVTSSTSSGGGSSGKEGFDMLGQKLDKLIDGTHDPDWVKKKQATASKATSQRSGAGAGAGVQETEDDIGLSQLTAVPANGKPR